jgi:hypothetical protein
MASTINMVRPRTGCLAVHHPRRDRTRPAREACEEPVRPARTAASTAVVSDRSSRRSDKSCTVRQESHCVEAALRR